MTRANARAAAAGANPRSSERWWCGSEREKTTEMGRRCPLSVASAIRPHRRRQTLMKRRSGQFHPHLTSVASVARLLSSIVTSRVVLRGKDSPYPISWCIRFAGSCHIVLKWFMVTSHRPFRLLAGTNGAAAPV